MKKERFYIIVLDRTHENSVAYLPVDAEPFSYKGHELFIRSIEDKNGKKFWNVSESKTGMKVSQDTKTKVQAKKSAMEIIDGTTPEEIERRIAKHIEKYGISPRHEAKAYYL